MTLIVQDVSHRFGAQQALDGASLDAKAGEIVCLFGPSGCGKTTLLRLVAGFETLQAGRIELDGAVLAEPGRALAPERRPVGFVFQDFALFPHLSVAQNVGFGLASLDEAARWARVAEELRAVDLDGIGDRYPHELSGGQQQRVALARAAARRPRALLLDEPFASIDSSLRRRLRGDLRQLLRARAAATLIVTHDPEEAIELADRIAIMRQGRVIELATPSDLRQRPATPEGAAIFPGAERLDFETVDGRATTAFGAVDSPTATARGCAVIGPGGVSVDRAGLPNALTIESRFNGECWTVLVESLTHKGARLRARAAEEAPAGAAVRIMIDPGKTTFFPA